jgi:hypothetical protein
MGAQTNHSELKFSERLDRPKGRPVRDRMASARVTSDELTALESAAAREGKLLAEWAREVLLREARKTERDPVFTEIVATRMLLNLVLKHIACGERLTAEMFSAVLTTVRTTKQKQAVELMQQYTSTDEKES